jgi:glyoxylase-like metal-dependent hydrolase (beta-lactamase superfamily II)
MNAYLVGCEETRNAAIIDAGDQVNDLLDLAEKHNLNITKILQTHGHVDHVGAISGVKEKTGARVFLHQSELPVYNASPAHGMMYGITGITVPEPDEFIHEGMVIDIGNLKTTVIETPGHTPGGVVYYFLAAKTVFVGDTLFAGSVGRTDLPGGDFSVLTQSLLKLMDLPGETVVYSGHGPNTTIARERSSNPFIRQVTQ